MNTLRKIAGLVLILLAVSTVCFMLYRAKLELRLAALSDKPGELLNQRMFWFIVIPIFAPIMAGLALFGWYALRGEYRRFSGRL